MKEILLDFLTFIAKNNLELKPSTYDDIINSYLQFLISQDREKVSIFNYRLIDFINHFRIF
jgi:hypothetical protein